MTRRDRFTPLLGQREIDRLQELHERKLHAEYRRRAWLRAAGWSLLVLGQIALIVGVAAQHEAWPW